MRAAVVAIEPRTRCLPICAGHCAQSVLGSFGVYPCLMAGQVETAKPSRIPLMANDKRGGEKILHGKDVLA